MPDFHGQILAVKISIEIDQVSLNSPFRTAVVRINTNRHRDTTSADLARVNAVRRHEESRIDREVRCWKAKRPSPPVANNDVTGNLEWSSKHPGSSCDVAFRTELRSVDNSRVIAVHYTSVRRLNILNPLGLALPTPKLETRLDPKTGASVKIVGTIERKAGFSGDVTVSTIGQPGGVTVSSVVLLADKSDFELELKFPANFQPSEVNSIKVFATGPFDAKVANIVVRKELPITVNVLAAEVAPQ